jgi:hypothetical protein
MISRSRTDRAYRLGCNIDHLGESAEDAWLINYPNAPDSGMFWRVTDPLDLPKKIEFEAIGSMLDITDYPYTDVTWPIMSKRMLNTLLSVGSFPHRVYPVVMLNVEEVYDSTLKKYIAPRTENNNYVAVHLTEHLDIFDTENSVYQRDSDNPEWILMNSVKWLTIREPETGFPPLFNIKSASTDIFVSAQARIALETASIQGIDFLHIENSTIS